MIVGFTPGAGLLHRAHPFTNLALAGAVVVLAVALPAPVGGLGLTAALVVLAVAAGLSRILPMAAGLAAPFWVFLVLIHAVFGDDPGVALTVGSQLTAVFLVFLLALAAVHPGRLVDALLERGAPFSAAYLLAATLQAVPRLRDRAGAILDAQRCRGLRVRGSVWRRAQSVVPLAVPLVLGALGEVDERSIALDARGVAAASRRTPLTPPRDTAVDRLVRWSLLALAIATVVLRIVS